MLFTLDEIMTPREACDRLGVSLDSLHMKLNRLKNSDMLNRLIKDGKAKYYKPEGKQRENGYLLSKQWRNCILGKWCPIFNLKDIITEKENFA